MCSLRPLSIVAVALICGCAPDNSGQWFSRIKQDRADFPTTSTRPLSRDYAFKVLLRTEVFAGAYVGFAPVKSVQVQAFQVLLSQPDAITAFYDLLHRGYPAGKLYALCGIYLLDPSNYPKAERPFLDSDVTVDEMSADTGSILPMREIVRCSDPNTVRLRPGETIRQWFDRVKPAEDGARFDISGGAIPETFRDAK